MQVSIESNFHLISYGIQIIYLQCKLYVTQISAFTRLWLDYTQWGINTIWHYQTISRMNTERLCIKLFLVFEFQGFESEVCRRLALLGSHTGLLYRNYFIYKKEAVLIVAKVRYCMECIEYSSFLETSSQWTDLRKIENLEIRPACSFILIETGKMQRLSKRVIRFSHLYLTACTT